VTGERREGVLEGRPLFPPKTYLQEKKTARRKIGGKGTPEMGGAILCPFSQHLPCLMKRSQFNTNASPRARGLDGSGTKNLRLTSAHNLNNRRKHHSKRGYGKDRLRGRLENRERRKKRTGSTGAVRRTHERGIVREKGVN